METVAGAYPEDNIFSASISPGSDHLANWDLVGRTLAGVVRPLALLQRILFFVYPERVLISRLPPLLRRLLREDCVSTKAKLLCSRFTYTPAGLPATLLCCAPGAWAELLPRLLSEEEAKQDQLCFAHQPEGFALLACVFAKHGNALRTLRVAVQSSSALGNAATTAGAAGMLFSSIARGDLPNLKSLTLVDAGGCVPYGGRAVSSFLAPLARPGAAPLKLLRTLRLSLCGSAASAHLGCLTTFARQGGLTSLRTLAIPREQEEPEVQDADVAALLRAIIGRRPPLSAAPAAAPLAAASPPLAPDEWLEVAAPDLLQAAAADDAQSDAACAAAAADAPEPWAAGAAAAGVAPGGGCELTSIDLTGTLAGPATLEVLLELRRTATRPIAVGLDEHQALHGKIRRLLPLRWP